MKTYLVLPLTTVVSVALFAYMKSSQTDRERQNRYLRFQDIKLRVTYDVLREYEKEASEGQSPIDLAIDQEKVLQGQVTALQATEQKAKAELDQCKQSQKSSSSAMSAAETDLAGAKASCEEEAAKWTAEIESLTHLLEERSPACKYLPKDTQPGAVVRQLCGIEEPPKAPEAPKAEPAKEVPKQEEPKKKEEKPKEGKQ